MVGSEVGLSLRHPFPDIFLVDDVVAIVHAVGLVARDLFRYLAGNPCSIHIARRTSPVVVHQFLRQPGFYPCGTPRPVVVFDPIPLPVENIGT